MKKTKKLLAMFDRSSHHVYHGKYGVCGNNSRHYKRS